MESQRNFDGIPLEFHRNTAANFVQIYRMFSRIIPMNSCGIFFGILMEFLWHFLEFGWYFDGILVVF